MDLTAAGPLRRSLCVTAVAATLPYLTLKLLWLGGSQVGVIDPDFLDPTVLWWLNLLTFGMDAAAVTLALAFVRPWGRRAPAGLLAFPMWVATGLLGTLFAAVLLLLGANLLFGAAPRPANEEVWLADWVFMVVYGGFSVQAVALTGGFVLYARERWAPLFRARIGELPRTATLPLQRTLAAAALLLAAPAAALFLYWAGGGTWGRSIAAVQEMARPPRILCGLTAVALLTATAALLLVVLRQLPGRRVLPTLLTVWAAGGSVFGWGCWTLLAANVGALPADPRHAVPGVATLATAAQVGVGLLVLVVGALALIEHAAARTDVQSVR